MDDKPQPSVLVTGASSGMGNSIARRLLADGSPVCMAAHSTRRMAYPARLGAVLPVLDRSKAAGTVAAVAAITERSGGVDALVSGAVQRPHGQSEDDALDAVRHQFEINAFGPVRLIQLLLPTIPAMRKAAFVRTSAMEGRMSAPLWVCDHVAKQGARVGSTACDPLATVPCSLSQGWALLQRGGLACPADGRCAATSARVASWSGRGLGSDPRVRADMVGKALGGNLSGNPLRCPQICAADDRAVMGRACVRLTKSKM